MMDWYMKNLAFFLARDYQLYEQLLQRVEPRPEADWSIVDEMMRPKEWLFGLGSFSSSETLAVYGFGDGGHIMYLLGRLNDTGQLINLIPDVPEFLELLHTADMEELLADPRFCPVVFGLNNEMLLSYLVECYSPETISRAKVFSLPGYEEAYPEGLVYLEQAILIVEQWMR